MPLGTLESVEFHERELDLRQGDTVLIMTDGFVEISDVDGDLLGYDRARAWFADLAHLAPDAIVEGLVERARAFLAGTPLDDDMTLLVLKAHA